MMAFATEYKISQAFKEQLKALKVLGDLLLEEVERRERSLTSVDLEEIEAIVKDKNDLERLLHSAQSILSNWWGE